MKTKVIYTVMMMALVAVFTTTLTACGGDSDDPLDNPNPAGDKQGNETNDGDGHKVTYFTLCTNWNYTETEVKQYMSQFDWLTMKNNLDWGNKIFTPRYYIRVWYYLDDNGKLRESHVWYDCKWDNLEDDFKYIFSETERAYNVKLKMGLMAALMGDDEDGAYNLYSDGKNGWWVEVGHGTEGVKVSVYKEKHSMWPSKYTE